MKYLTKLAFSILATTPLLFAGNAKASLIGDTVDLGFFAPTLNDPTFPAVPLLVEEGTADAFLLPLSASDFVVINPEAESIVVDFTFDSSDCDCRTFPEFPFDDSFNGAVISDLDLGTTLGAVTGVSLSTDLSGFDASRILSTADSVSLDFQGFTFPIGTSRITLDLETESESVPEPFAILGTSLAMGYGLLINKRKIKSVG